MRIKYYVPIIIIGGIFVMGFLLYLPGNENYFSSVVAALKNTCQTIPTTTFIQSYRLKDTADSYAITQTKDGGYVITGHTVNPNEMKGPSMFFIKTDSNGSKKWSKLYDNGSSDGYAITQLTDGGIVAAGQVSGEFMTAEQEEQLEAQGDNLVVKLDNNGKILWTRTIRQQSIDTPRKLIPTKGGGFIMSGTTGKLVGKPDVADVIHTLFLGKFSGSGATTWLKKVEGDEQMADSVVQTKDGGFIQIGTVILVNENNQRVPAIVKLTSRGAYEWVTGLESVPLEFPMLEPDGKGGFTWKAQPSKMHLPFGTFLSAKQTDDGGYIALGEFFSTTLARDEISALVKNSGKESKFVAVKVDYKGKLQWARVLEAKKYLQDIKIEKTRDGGFIIMGNNLVGQFGDNASAERLKKYEDMMSAYYKKYPFGTSETAASKKAMEQIADAIDKEEAPFRARNVVLFKTDANFQYQWGKIIGGSKDLDGYEITQTADLGYAITGTWHTGIKHKVLGAWMEYTEAMIMKLDATGNLGNDNGLVANFFDTSSSDVSSYVITDPLNSPEFIVEYPMENTARSIRLSDKKGVNTITSEAKTYNATLCNVISKNDVPSDSGIIKTRPQMKFEETKEIVATSKNGKPINDELMPVLKRIFVDVKLWDDFAGITLDYRFKRLVTKNDIAQLAAAVQALGYHVESDANGDFTATKIGRTLNFHFKLGDLNVGQLELTY